MAADYFRLLSTAVLVVAAFALLWYGSASGDLLVPVIAGALFLLALVNILPKMGDDDDGEWP